MHLCAVAHKCKISDELGRLDFFTNITVVLDEVLDGVQPLAQGNKFSSPQYHREAWLSLCLKTLVAKEDGHSLNQRGLATTELILRLLANSTAHVIQFRRQLRSPPMFRIRRSPR